MVGMVGAIAGGFKGSRRRRWEPELSSPADLG